MSYNAAAELTTSIQGSAVTTYTFDKAGNRTGDNVLGALITRTYDSENRLAKISSAGGVSTYTYAGTGLRRSKQKAGQPVTTFIWDGSDYLGEI